RVETGPLSGLDPVVAGDDLQAAVVRPDEWRVLAAEPAALDLGGDPLDDVLSQLQSRVVRVRLEGRYGNVLDLGHLRISLSGGVFHRACRVPMSRCISSSTVGFSPGSGRARSASSARTRASSSSINGPPCGGVARTW